MLQGENIKLDPELHAACKDDVSKYCAKVKAGSAAVSFGHFNCASTKSSGDNDDSTSLLPILCKYF